MPAGLSLRHNDMGRVSFGMPGSVFPGGIQQLRGEAETVMTLHRPEGTPGPDSKCTKVWRAAAENYGMRHEHPMHSWGDSIFAEARALEASIRAIREAQGKKNPSDFPPDSPACLLAMDEFAHDVCRALGVDPIASGEVTDDALHWVATQRQ
ncbi:hypothetical protein PWR66_04230 [Paraburkholderia sp. A1RO-5]|uniref:hypothetical protein n=1 Tax=Paraburkholderia sp. A1RO-5 TaxID=3028369 RepID=UPI003B75F77E